MESRCGWNRSDVRESEESYVLVGCRIGWRRRRHQRGIVHQPACERRIGTDDTVEGRIHVGEAKDATRETRTHITIGRRSTGSKKRRGDADDDLGKQFHFLSPTKATNKASALVRRISL